jgi:hypothetical protein
MNTDREKKDRQGGKRGSCERTRARETEEEEPQMKRDERG